MDENNLNIYYICIQYCLHTTVAYYEFVYEANFNAPKFEFAKH